MTVLLSATGLAGLHLSTGPEFTVSTGEVVVITGDSPATTELLWALAGLDVRAGVAVVATHDEVDSATRGHRRRPATALVPQGNALARTLTAAENLVLPLLATGLGAAAAEERASAVLDRLGLGESGTHLVEELSGGQQQRVAVGRALSLHPDVILADDPTSDLDPVNRRLVLDVLAGHAQHGGAVVIASDDPDAARVATRIVVADALAWGP